MLGLRDKKIVGFGQHCSENFFCLLGDETDKPTWQKTFAKLRMVQNWIKNDKNLFKGIQYNPKTLISFVS